MRPPDRAISARDRDPRSRPCRRRRVPARDERERLGEVGLHQAIAGTWQRAVGAPEGAVPRTGTSPAGSDALLKRVGQGPAHVEAVARQRDGRRDHLGERQPSIALCAPAPVPATDPGTPEASGPTRLRSGTGSPGCIEEHVAVRRGRRHFAVVDGGLAAIGHANHHEPAAAQIAGGRDASRPAQSQRRRRRRWRCRRVQDLKPGAAGVLVGRSDHAMASPHRARATRPG